jgi:hypothetical protein
LDGEAFTRGTTVYLVDRRLDMLPPLLSEHLCSLRSNQDRLSVSVLWTLTTDLEVRDTWFGRTVIRYICNRIHSPLYPPLTLLPLHTLFKIHKRSCSGISFSREFCKPFNTGVRHIQERRAVPLTRNFWTPALAARSDGARCWSKEQGQTVSS